MMLGIREYLYLAAIAGLIGAIWYFGWHERSIEHAKDIAANQAALIKAQHEYEARVAADTKVNEDVSHAYEAEVARLRAVQPIGPVRLCRSVGNPQPSSPAPTVAGRPREATPAGGSLVTVPQGTDLGPDLGPGLQLIADVADQLGAQVRELLAREKAIH